MLNPAPRLRRDNQSQARPADFFRGYAFLIRGCEPWEGMLAWAQAIPNDSIGGLHALD